jgi:hypothetical protein
MATVGVTVGLRDAVGVTVGPGFTMGADEHALVSRTITTETAAQFIGLSLLAEHQSRLSDIRETPGRSKVHSLVDVDLHRVEDGVHLGQQRGVTFISQRVIDQEMLVLDLEARNMVRPP